MGDIFILIILATVISSVVVGIPLYLIRGWLLKEPPKNHPYRKPAIFVNQLGHLQIVEPDPCMQEKVLAYFNANPKEAKEFIDGLHEKERW